MQTFKRRLKCSNNLVKRRTNHTWNHTGIMFGNYCISYKLRFCNCNFGSVDQVNVLFLRSFVGFSLFHSLVSLSWLANWSIILTGQQMAKTSQNLSDQNSLTNGNHPGLSWSHSLVKLIVGQPTGLTGQQIEIYRSCESWIHKLSICMVRIGRYLAEI